MRCRNWKLTLYYWLMAVACPLVKKTTSCSVFCSGVNGGGGHELCQSLRSTLCLETHSPQTLEDVCLPQMVSPWKARDRVWLTHYSVTKAWHMKRLVNIFDFIQPHPTKWLFSLCLKAFPCLVMLLPLCLQCLCTLISFLPVGGHPGPHSPEGSFLGFWRLWRVL